MASTPGAKSMTQPKADQPRVETSSLRKGEAGANLTYRQQGVKNYTGRSQRDYTRR
jgi:hypothetical protein